MQKETKGCCFECKRGKNLSIRRRGLIIFFIWKRHDSAKWDYKPTQNTENLLEFIAKQKKKSFFKSKFDIKSKI